MVSLVQLISLIFSLEVVDLVSVSTSFLIYLFIYLYIVDNFAWKFIGFLKTDSYNFLECLP